MRNHWIAVASAGHVARGRAEGFMQVCHGKAAPLRRLKAGDEIVYYSPTTTFGGADQLQAFTALGAILAGEPYQADMGGGFRPFRRDVDWSPACHAPIRPLLDRLEFTAGRASWGAPFRYGLFRVSQADFTIVATAMGVEAATAA